MKWAFSNFNTIVACWLHMYIYTEICSLLNLLSAKIVGYGGILTYTGHTMLHTSFFSKLTYNTQAVNILANIVLLDDVMSNWR